MWSKLTHTSRCPAYRGVDSCACERQGLKLKGVSSAGNSSKIARQSPYFGVIEVEFTFTLKYELQASDTDALVERLAEEGCGDALVGVGQSGRLSLEFAREAGSVKEAVESALDDVRRAVPDAKLIAATPVFCRPPRHG